MVIHEYNGYIDIDKKSYSFSFSNFKFSIHVGTIPGDYVGWGKIKQIVNDGWIHAFDLAQNELYLYVDSADYSFQGDYVYNIAGYIRMFYLNRKSSRNSKFSSEEIIFKHSVIDYLFACDDEYMNRISYLLDSWKSQEAPKEMLSSRKEYELDISGNKYLVSFPTYIQYSYDNPFPFEFFNTITVKSSKSSCGIKEVWEIASIIQLFLQLVSQTRIIVLDEVMLNFNNRENHEYNAWLYMRPQKDAPSLSRCSILPYNNINKEIGNILNQIASNQICFRSLFNYHSNEIITYDIMNICAAFEAQFLISYPKFKDKEQSAIKARMVADLETKRSEYSGKEASYFDDILNGLKNYNDTLQKRLQYALDEFTRVYGDDDTKFDFHDEYSTLPKRIKDTRNALDHGNYKYKLTPLMFRDVELLRAIIYMLILEQANMDEKNIKACLKKLSRFPH